MSTDSYQPPPGGFTDAAYGHHAKRKRFLDLITAWERFSFPFTTLLNVHFNGEVLILSFYTHHATIHGAGLGEVYEQLLDERVSWIRMMTEAECLAAAAGKVTVRSIKLEKGAPK